MLGFSCRLACVFACLEVASFAPSGCPVAPASEALSAFSFGCSAAVGWLAVFCATSSGCEKLAGVISPGVTTTRAPILVQPHILMAKAVGMRMQPCDAG